MVLLCEALDFARSVLEGAVEDVSGDAGLEGQ